MGGHMTIGAGGKVEKWSLFPSVGSPSKCLQIISSFQRTTLSRRQSYKKRSPPPTPQACSIGRSERMNGGENVRMKVLQDREIVRHKIIKDIDWFSLGRPLKDKDGSSSEFTLILMTRRRNCPSLGLAAPLVFSQGRDCIDSWLFYSWWMALLCSYIFVGFRVYF